jgi:hypothetical protein
MNIWLWISMFVAIFGGSYAGYRKRKKNMENENKN